MPHTSSSKSKKTRFKTQALRRIAILGPESTGKSVLAANLAEHYKTDWVHEFSREYLTGLERPYDYNDILEIAKGQLILEEELAEKASRFLFCDTEMITNMIWCLEKYGKCHPWIFGKTMSQAYDLYLLCNTDLEWEFDPLRESPDQKDRDQLFDIYKKALQDRSLPYVVVSGKDKARFENAIQIIDNKFKPSPFTGLPQPK